MNSKQEQGEVIFGISPLGGNSVEGTGPGMSPIRDMRIQGVPLFYDSRVGVFISEQAVDELNDRDIDREKNLAFQAELSFRRRAGYRTTINPSVAVEEIVDEESGYGSGEYGEGEYGD